MTLTRLVKRRFKYIYYDDARTQLNVRSDVYAMDEAPPGTDCWGESNGRGPTDTDERRGYRCRNGRDDYESDDHWRTGYKRDSDWEHRGKEDSPYTCDSNRWTEEDWLHYEQTQNEI